MLWIVVSFCVFSRDCRKSLALFFNYFWIMNWCFFEYGLLGTHGPGFIEVCLKHPYTEFVAALLLYFCQLAIFWDGSPCHIRVSFSWIHGLQGPVNHCILTQPQPLPFKVVEVVCKVRCKILHINRKVLILGRVCMQSCPTELWMLMETFQIWVLYGSH